MAGQEGSDVAESSAVAHDGLAESGQPRVTWATIRWVTAVQVCGPGVSGTLSMMAVAGRSRAAGRPGAAAVWIKPLMKRGFLPMLPDATLPVPASLASLLAVFGPLFTAPSFRTFCGLACGFLSQAGKRTVCGMLAGAGLSRIWPHDRTHRFFARARWNADDLGLAVARLVVALLVRPGSRWSS